MAKDLQYTNPTVSKASSKKLEAVAPEAKIATPAIEKTTKPSPNEDPAKKPVKKGVIKVSPAEEVRKEVVVHNSRGQQIKLPTRFK